MNAGPQQEHFVTSRNPVPRRLLQAFVLAVPVMCFATAAFAETAAPDQDSQGSTIDDESEEAAAKAGSGWSLDPGLRITARGITARSTAPAEDEVVDGNALAVVITPSLVLAKDDVTVTLRNATTRLEFEDEARTDRWQNAARLAVAYDLSNATRLTAFGERSDNILAAEFTSTDEWEFGGEIIHSVDAANRVTLGASWRERSYDDAAGSSGDGIRVDGEYRYRFGPNHYAFLRGRYDEINSAEARRNLTRWLAEASYQRPIASDLRLRGELSYQRLDFGGRPVAGGGSREDDLFWPELTLIWSPGPWRIAGEARYIVRNSTDPAFDRSGYRFEVEVSHAF
ncbi:MAG: hypothetical protein C0472_09405 [Erythrobacter sp.]|nr:hypothetical protein [Erythrobacter sp.]